MLSKILITTLLSLFLVVAYSGHIHPQDIIISPNNKNTLSEITLIFTLDTTIAPTDYLRVVFPFRLNDPQPANWDTYVSCSLTGAGKLATVTPSVLPSDSTSYFVQFYTDLTPTTRSGLTANVTYYVKLRGTPDLASTTGVNLPVQVLTVSTTQQGYVVYDMNSGFGTVTLADAYPSTMTVFVTIPSTETSYNVLGSTYKIWVDITPRTTIKNRARVDIEVTNSTFTLLSCTSIAVAAENIPQLRATFDVFPPNRVRATISQTLTAGNGAKYRFECRVTNPALPGSTRIAVRNRLGYVETITESGTDSIGLQAATTANPSSTSQWDETSHKVLLGWGVEASSPTALNIFGLYKDASPTERWYQSTKTIFKPRVALTYTDKLQVVISTVNDAGFKLLTASIHHDLPAYPGLTVKCAQLVQGYIHCQNVGNLANIAYFVSFRFGLLSTTAALAVTDFGKISVQSMATSPVVLMPLSLTTLTFQTIRANIALFTGTPATNGIVAYSTRATALTTTTYVTNDVDVILKFKFKYFTSTFIPLVTTTIDRGIEFYTSSALGSSVTPDCTIDTLTQTTDVVISDCSVTQVTASSFTRLRFRLANFARVIAPVSTLFTSSNLDGTILFNKVNFAGQFSSLNYVSENVFDYYVRWVQNFTALNPTIVTATGSSPFFFNSIVHKDGALANLKVGTSLFVTGQTAADLGNDGTYFPSMIRVMGSSFTEIRDRILVFFNDLEPLNKDTPCFGSVAVTCRYDANAQDTTQTNGLTDYSGSRRIEINFSGAATFNIYIPVRTTTQKLIYGFFVATAAVVDAAATSQGIFATKETKRIDLYTSTALNTSNSIMATTTAPSMTITTNAYAMGATVPTLNLNNPNSATYSASPINSGTAIGAAYAYCANYDFTSAASFSMAPFYAGGTASLDQSCVTVKYSPSTVKDVTCQVCPVHNTMGSGPYAFNNFKMPDMAGKDYADFTYAVGKANGDAMIASKDAQTGKLTAYNLASVGLTFDPVDFKKTSKGVYATLTFTTASILPKTIKITISPTSGTLYMAPVTTVACQVTSLVATSCATSGTASSMNLDIVAQANTWPQGTHVVKFMVDASGASGLGSNTTVSYKAVIYVNGISASVLHHDSSATTYIVSTSAALDIVLSNFTYLFTNKQARTIVKFDFEIPNDIKVYPNQKIAFNLGAIATENSGPVPWCRVNDYGADPLGITPRANSDFAVCDATVLSQVTLQPKAAVTGRYGIELHFLKVASSAAPAGITAKVLAADGTTVIAQNLVTTPLAIPVGAANAIIPTVNVRLDRLYSDPGEVGEIILTVKPSVLAIELGTFMYIYFPPYYPDKLGYENIWCTANDLPISCFIIKTRLMQLTSFPVNVAVGSSVEVRIYGVITPAVPVPPGKVFVGLAPKTTPYVLTEQIEISDKASNSALPAPLSIDFYTITTTKIREKADHTIIFTTGASGIRANRKISIDFADRFGGTLRGQEGPYIIISKVGDTVVTQVQAVSFGSRFKITLPLDLDPLSQYQFVLKGIDNPEQAICIMDKPMVIVTDSAENAATSRTAPNIWDVPTMDFAADPNLKMLSWTDKAGTAITSVTLTIGIFSPEIRIIPPAGESFSGDLTFTTSQTALSILPGVLKATRGSSYLSLRVGADISSLPSIVLLDLNKDEAFANSIYSQAPKLQLILTNQLKTLPLPAISIMKGGTSLPYEWDLSALDLIPHTELKIDVTIDDPAGPLSVVGPTTLIFTPDAPKAGFVFALAASATTSPTFTLALSGEDATYYTMITPTVLNSTVSVTVVNAVATAPVLTATTTLNYAATRQQFALTCDQMASVYWHVALENKLTTTDCLRVRSNYNAGTAFDATSADQAQYGVFRVFTTATPENHELGNLMSNTRYSYILCAENQLGTMGTSVTSTFQTKDNTASIYELTLTFSSAINRNQLASLICVFIKELQLPNENVVAADGTTCAYPSVYDSFSSFSYTSVTIYVHGNKRSDTNSDTDTKLTQSVNAITAQTAGSFLTSFNQALQGAGIRNQFQTITKAAGPTYTAPALETTAVVSAASETNSITLGGLQLTAGTNGVFFGIATENLTDKPTAAQIKNKMNPDGTSTSGANAFYTGSGSVVLTFKGLKANTEYMVYYYALNADRTQYAMSTEVKYVRKSTQPVPEVKGAWKTETGFLTVILLSMIALLM